MLGVRVPDREIGCYLDLGRTKRRVLHVEVSIRFLNRHSYYRGRKKNSLLAVGQLVRLRKRERGSVASRLEQSTSSIGTRDDEL